jgi:hypothetical protein
VPVLTNQLIAQGGDRTYHVQVTANPAQATVPAIVVFHGDGQDAATIAPGHGRIPYQRLWRSSSPSPAVITEADAGYVSRAVDDGRSEPVAAALAVSS